MTYEIEQSQYFGIIKLLEDLGPTPQKCKAFFSVALDFTGLKDDEVAYAFDFIVFYAKLNCIDLREYLFDNREFYNDFYILLYVRIEKYTLGQLSENVLFTKSEKKRL
ncbi:hypothetical protein [Pantoea sp. EEL5]|uniref:hypothetical protein n=1 Tax=Pantoea sp. EEL5 TaxID=3416806 RepID=UPI003CF15DD3